MDPFPRVMFSSMIMSIYNHNIHSMYLVVSMLNRSWWRHQMETFSALLAICAGNSPVTGVFPHNGQWSGALMFSLIFAWINGGVSNREAVDLRRYHPNYDVTEMQKNIVYESKLIQWWHSYCEDNVWIHFTCRFILYLLLLMVLFPLSHDDGDGDGSHSSAWIYPHNTLYRVRCSVENNRLSRHLIGPVTCWHVPISNTNMSEIFSINSPLWIKPPIPVDSPHTRASDADRVINQSINVRLQCFIWWHYNT